MNEGLLLFNYCLLIAVVIIGVYQYKYLDGALKVLTLLMIVTAFIEIAAYILLIKKMYILKNTLVHVFNVVELIFVTTICLKINKPRHYRKLMIANILLWASLGILNVIFLQPVTGLNTNILMLESFSIITMALFTIYRMLKNDRVHNIFLNSYFWLCVIWLVQWSSTFFFWAFIRILYHTHWTYINFAMDMNTTVNFFANAGIFTIFFYYSKMIKVIENR